MNKVMCNFLFTIFFSGLGIMVAKSQTNMVFEEVDGLVAVEAEHFSTQRKSDKRMWYIHNSNTPESTVNISESASNNAYIKILPDTRKNHSDILMHGENFSNIPGTMAIVEYQVYFNNPGRYYMWARCYSTGPEDNGVHVGINGNWPSSGQRMQWCAGKNTWRWESKQRTREVHCGVPGMIYLDVPSEGIHNIAFSLREDGFSLDKWIMTQNPDFESPAGSGPDEKLFTGTSQIKTNNDSYHLSAIEDFDNITSGEAPYYIDKARKALAINAANDSFRDKFASASTTFYGESNVYDAIITTLAEFDGECTYRFAVNGSIVGSFKNTSVSKDDDYKPIQAVFRSVKLSANDLITVESNSHTNGLIPEGEGTAWARGRWTQLTLIPSHERSIVRDLPGRIAWSADGNQHDTDDWLASPWALAMFRAAGIDRKVVYFGYNSHLWDTRDEYDKIHEDNIKGTVLRWGGYKSTAFFNELSETNAATDKLVEEINKSTESDPLWLVAAGPIETYGFAIEKANADALKHVTVLSHSTWNTDHSAKEHDSKYSLEFIREKGVNYKKIKDQNNQNGAPAWTAQGLKRKTEYFEFLKGHKDERMQWLWTCRVMPQYENPNYQKGFYDYSDSGMAYWLITGANNGGDEDATPQKTFDLLEGFINGHR